MGRDRISDNNEIIQKNSPESSIKDARKFHRILNTKLSRDTIVHYRTGLWLEYFVI